MTKKQADPAPEGAQAEPGMPEADAHGAQMPAAEAPKPKAAKPSAATTAKIRACTTMAELQTLWAGLKPEQRDLAAYYETGRRISAANVP